MNDVWIPLSALDLAVLETLFLLILQGSLLFLAAGVVTYLWERCADDSMATPNKRGERW